MDAWWFIVLLAAIAAALFALRAFALRRRRRLRLEYQRLLEQALSDGVLQPEEIAELEAVRAKGALTADEVRMAALAIYRRTLRDAAADSRLTAEEDAALRRLQQQLELTDHDLGRDQALLCRLRLLARVAEGNLPEVQAPVQLVPDERCHWVVQCTLADRIPLAQQARGPLAGISFEVQGGEPFAATGSRDELRPAEDILPSDLGALVITSRRVIFRGARRTVSVPHARIDRVTLYADGVRIEEIAQSARRYFLVDDPDLACAILLQAARLRRAEIRPARQSRTSA
jgi:hypothetical protein